LGIVFLIVLSLGSLVALSGFSLDQELQSMGWSAPPFQEGATVKVHGTIMGLPGTVVLDGTWHASGKYGSWEWAGSNFAMQVGSYNFTVDVSWLLSNGEVFSAPHQISNTEQQYLAGDSITLVGVAGSLNGSVPFQAHYVAQYPYDFISGNLLSYDLFVAIVVSDLVAIAAILIGALKTRSWVRQMHETWGPDGPTSEKLFQRPPQSPLPWT
jgi:hypothetical protein